LEVGNSEHTVIHIEEVERADAIKCQTCCTI